LAIARGSRDLEGGITKSLDNFKKVEGTSEVRKPLYKILYVPKHKICLEHEGRV
jgi:hypothetical protein